MNKEEIIAIQNQAAIIEIRCEKFLEKGHYVNEWNAQDTDIIIYHDDCIDQYTTKVPWDIFLLDDEEERKAAWEEYVEHQKTEEQKRIEAALKAAEIRQKQEKEARERAEYERLKAKYG